MAGLILPVVLAGIGGAVDISNAHNRKQAMQRAADAAALAGARSQTMEVAAVEAFAITGAAQAEVVNLAATARRDGDAISVQLRGNSDSHILGLIGIDTFDLVVDSIAQSVGNAPKNLEVAIALDVTESMANDMDELRTAAGNLVEDLFDSGSQNVKISIVPYTGAVNIGTTTNRTPWLDVAGTSQHHAMDVENRLFAWCYTPAAPSTTPTAVVPTNTGSSSPPPMTPSCTAVCDCPGTPDCGGGGDGASLTPKIGRWFAETLGIKPAYANNSLPTYQPDLCEYQHTPNQISHLDLFDAIQGVEWGGCVEARPAPYDVTDDAPSSFDPDTLFTPYFWSDDWDQFDSSTYSWANQYAIDTAAPDIDTTRVIDSQGSTMQHATSNGDRRGNVLKYTTVTAADMNLTPPNITGPNRGCPSALTPLTDREPDILNSISALQHRVGGGTVLPQGLVWSWRALSPGQPFTEGNAYEDTETRKIVILMSDGANALIKREDNDGSIADNSRRSDYTAYGYAADFDQNGRTRGYVDTSLDTSTPYFRQMRDYLDDRTLQVCTNIKNASETNPIEIYTLLLGDGDADSADLLRQCATTPDNHYERALTAADLDLAFDRIFANITGASGSRLVQ